MSFSINPHIKLNLCVVSVLKIQCPVVRRDRQQLPFTIIHELSRVIGDFLSRPPQS